MSKTSYCNEIDEFENKSFFFFHSAIMCLSLVPLENGSISYSPDSGDNFTIGTTATYSCSAGFALVGGDNIRSCMDDDQADTEGVWRGTASTCQGS